MRVLSLLLLMLLAGCSLVSSPPLPAKVVLPDTPQAQACERGCKQSYESCDADCGPFINAVMTICHTPCRDAWQECLAYCPGAQAL